MTGYRVAAGHAWNVWPDPEPETERRLIERLRRLAAETHGEVCMSRVIAAVDLVEEALPAIRAEATAAALAPYVAALREKVEALPTGGHWDLGSECVSRAAVLSLLAAPLSVREAGLDVETVRRNLRAAVDRAQAMDPPLTVIQWRSFVDGLCNPAVFATTPERPADEVDG